jgi:hypothetical protein
MKTIKYSMIFSFLFLAACSSLILKPADFAWPVESVLKVDDQGNVQVDRYSLTFNTKELFLEETGDSLAYQNNELRVIRNNNGYYFMVANNFKNVYVFNTNDEGLKLDNKIEISDSTDIQNPSFNQRPPYIQLNYDEGKSLNLTNDGIAEEEKK